MSGARNTLSPRAAMPDDLGRRIRAERLAQNLSQDGVAQLSGLRRETVWRIEAGGPPSAHSVFAIEAALGLPSPYFVPDWEPCDPAARSIGPRIRERRRALRLSLYEVATAAGVSEATLSRFEREVVGSPALVEQDIDDRGGPVSRMRNAGLARALGFDDVDALQAHCDRPTA